MTDLPWWANLEKRRIVSKKEWERRYKNKKPRKKPKGRTPTQRIRNLSVQLGLSTRGNTKELIHRILQFLMSIILQHKQKGQACFGQLYDEKLCETCVLGAECKVIYDDLNNLRKWEKQYLIDKRIRRQKSG